MNLTGRLTFEPFKVWPMVRHLFEGKPGHWASGVEVSGNWMSPITVSCPEDMERTIRELLDLENIPYSVY